MVNIKLNHFDEEGNVVDSSIKTISKNQVSDIVDHAAQLVLVMREMAKGKTNMEVFDHVYSEMENALTSSDVIDEDSKNYPTLKLIK